MFGELKTEFPNHENDFPANYCFKIDELEVELGKYEYYHDIEVPYGEFKIEDVGYGSKIEIEAKYGDLNTPPEMKDLKKIPDSDK